MRIKGLHRLLCGSFFEVGWWRRAARERLWQRGWRRAARERLWQRGTGVWLCSWIKRF